LINFDYNTHKLKELTFVFKWTSVTVVNYNMFLGLQLSIVRNGESTDIILKRNKKFKLVITIFGEHKLKLVH